VKQWRLATHGGYAAAMETLIKKLVNVKSGEIKALLWSFAYFFFLLASYYILRPIRDEMGVAGGTRNITWLFGATALVLLAAAPLLAALVAKLPRQRFIPIVYLFFVANILIFWVLLKAEWQTVHVARVFFVWTAVFSVFTVSVFWSFMADLFTSEQSKRLFAFIAAGGALGNFVGPQLIQLLVGPLGPTNLLLVAAGMLAVAVVCSARVERASEEVHAASPGFTAASAGRDKQIVGGGIFDGLKLLFKSPYLGGIALWVFLLSFAGTMLYLLQADFVANASDDPSERLRIFARIEKWVAILTIAMQMLATGRLITKFGTGPAAAFLPLVFLGGFLVLIFSPVLAVVIWFQTLQRAANFGIANPARESLFTVVSREEKLKAKSIIDGAVFRGADWLNSVVYEGLRLVMSMPVMLVVFAVVCGGWMGLSVGLGRSQEKRASEPGAAK
jgi:AAA family ATP:ADP antiporter